MAAYKPSAAAPVGAISIIRSIPGLAALFAAVGAWNDARMTRKALARLTDRELDDIGLCRSDVEMLGR
jgi:uncharacterized protein YjiS (DUF1127 family)